VAPRQIPAFRLDPEPLTPEAAALRPFEWASPDVGNRHRLGGQPDEIQPGDRPRCPQCNEEMTFYGQLDSINDEFVLADAGVVQVFVCFGCFEAAARIASH
jgi:hypothetical protein